MKEIKLQGKVRLLFHSNIFKVFYSTGFTTGLKILATVVLSKVVALRLGPGGLALLGQLTNFVTIALLIGSGGFGNGIIKYVSSIKDIAELQSFSKQSLKLTLFLSLLAGVLIVCFCTPISLLIFNSTQFAFVFTALGVSIVFYAVANYFLSYINGMTEYKILNWTNGVNSILSLVVSVVLIYFYSLRGAFIAVAVNQSVSGLVTLAVCRKYLNNFTQFWKKKIQLEWVKNLLSFSLMAVVTAVLTPVAQIIIRKNLITQYNVTAAGEWEAINRISTLYLTVLTNVMLVYYLPKLSSIDNTNELKREIRKGFSFFGPIVLLLAFVVFLFKDIIITVFLSNQFVGIRPFFLPQLVGDAFKILSFIYAFLVIAKAKVTYYIVTEFLFIGIYLGCSLLLINSYGNIGAVYAYTITYVLYFLFQIVITRKYLLR